jgi:hypothetical protein
MHIRNMEIQLKILDFVECLREQFKTSYKI